MRQLSGPDLLAMLRACGDCSAGPAAAATPDSAVAAAVEPAAPNPYGTAPLLLDVREPWEVALAAICIDGLRTLHLPMNQVPSRLGELDPAQPVVCICHHGMRSAQVASFLERHGFDAVDNLAGGIDAWSQQVDPRVPRY